MWHTRPHCKLQWKQRLLAPTMTPQNAQQVIEWLVRIPYYMTNKSEVPLLVTPPDYAFTHNASLGVETLSGNMDYFELQYGNVNGVYSEYKNIYSYLSK